MKRLLLTSAVSVLALSGAALLPSAAMADPLIDAARAGNGAAALELIDDGADVNVASEDGTTALLWAIHNGDLDLVKRLIRKGADVSATNHYGATAMSEAAVRGDAGILEALLDAGADAESPNKDGQTALMVLARAQNLEAAQLLLDHGADVNAQDSWRGQTALMHAAAESRPAMVALLLENGADPNIRSFMNEHYNNQVSAETRLTWRTPSGWTALLLAAREGCVACVSSLLDGGADINMGNPENVSPLLAASLNFHYDTVKLLVERGADPDKWDWRGRTPLFAVVDTHTVPHGGRPDIPSTDVTTAMEAARLLLDAGANPDLQTKLNPDYRNTKDDRGADGNMQTAGVTALARAAKAFDLEMINLIAQYNPRVDLPNDRGLTPLMIAAGMGSTTRDTRGDYTVADVQQQSIATIDALLAMGANIDAQAANGQTALFAAAGWGWTEVAEHLVAKGADLEIRDARGLSVLDTALGRGGVGVRQNPVRYPETAARLEEMMREQGLEIPEPAGDPEQLAEAR